MTALKLELSIRAAATRTGGGGGPPVLATDGVLLTAVNDTLEIRDTVTPANAYKGPQSAKLSMTRASTAYYYDSSGILQTAAVNVLRLGIDPRVGQAGYRIEDARISVVRWSQDLTNVLWTKTNVTATQDQTGPDGLANSATKLTATGAAGTVLQTTTITSSARWHSAYVKRLTGTGVIEMTMDNVTWTPIVPTAAWARYEIPAQTLANPTVGFRMATSGDAIAVWTVQNENGLFASSPILTTSGVTTTRAADVPKLAGTLFPLSPLEGTLYVKAMVEGLGANVGSCLTVDDGTNLDSITIARNHGTNKLEILCRDDNVIQFNVISPTVCPFMSMFKMAGAYKLNDSNCAFSGETIGATDIACTIPTLTTLIFGNKTMFTVVGMNGWLFEAMYLPTRLTNTQLQSLVA